jgi:hypothetical protein
MNKQPLYRYLTLAALMSFWSCSSSLKTAQRSGETDDLYGTSATADVYASNSSDVASVAPRTSRYERQSRSSYRNANPDYVEDQQGYDANTDEYYADLSARKLKRGISADPGWNDSDYYNSGYNNGYNSALTSAYSWNRWGSFYNGFGPSLGMGLGYTGLSIGLGSPFYSPFGGYGGYAYSPFASPFGYGGGLYDPFYSSYAYGGGLYSPFYSPYGYGGYYGGGYGYGYGTPIYVNNPIIVGADPYRNARTYNGTASRSTGRYTNDFDNSNRSYNAGARRAAGNSTYTNSSGATVVRGSNGNYTSPRGGSRNGGNYYYDNSSAGSSAPAYSSGSNATGNAYYSSPRGGRSSSSGYTNSNARSGYSQPQQRTYQSPQQQTYQQPSYQSQSQSRSFSQPSFSAPSSGGFSGGSRGGGGGGSVGGGGGRGPR